MSHASEAVLGGWEWSTVTLFETGPYLTSIPAFDTANLNLVSPGATLRPACIGNPVPANPSVDRCFNIAAFNPVPGPGRIGDCARPGNRTGQPALRLDF
jgi:hypothetical protein